MMTTVLICVGLLAVAAIVAVLILRRNRKPASAAGQQKDIGGGSRPDRKEDRGSTFPKTGEVDEIGETQPAESQEELRIVGVNGHFAGRRFALTGTLRLGRLPDKNDLVFPADTTGGERRTLRGAPHHRWSNSYRFGFFLRHLPQWTEQAPAAAVHRAQTRGHLRPGLPAADLPAGAEERLTGNRFNRNAKLCGILRLKRNGTGAGRAGYVREVTGNGALLSILYAPCPAGAALPQLQT